MQDRGADRGERPERSRRTLEPSGSLERLVRVVRRQQRHVELRARQELDDIHGRGRRRHHGLALRHSRRQRRRDRAAETKRDLVHFTDDEDQPALPVHLPLTVWRMTHEQTRARTQPEEQEAAPIQSAAPLTGNKRAESVALRPWPEGRLDAADPLVVVVLPTLENIERENSGDEE